MIRGTVRHIDPDNDIAVIEIPKRTGGLQLSSEYMNSQSVTALGFPALGLRGKFQTAQGTISNSCIRRSELSIPGGERCLIQHTAAIDPGSSGGPLITQDNHLVGVNLGIVPERREVNMAVPVEAIRSAIQLAEQKRQLTKNAEASKRDLLQTCNRFGSELSSVSPKMAELMPLFSEKLIVEKGQETLEGLYTSSKLMETDPLYALRIRIMVKMQTIVQENKGMGDKGCVLADSTDLFSKDGVRTIIHLNSGLRFNVTWALQAGWVVINY